MKMLKWFLRSCVALLNKILFVDLGVKRYFTLAPCYSLTMMMGFVFSFLPSYFTIIFLAKGKISESGSLFLSHIGGKQCWSVRLQDFKSKISLKQSDEIVCFFTCWYQKLRVDRKILGWLWSEVVVATLVTRSMDEWIELIFCMLIHGVRKAKSYFGYAHGQIWLWPFRSWDSKICFISTQK